LSDGNLPGPLFVLKGLDFELVLFGNDAGTLWDMSGNDMVSARKTPFFLRKPVLRSFPFTVFFKELSLDSEDLSEE